MLRDMIYTERGKIEKQVIGKGNYRGYDWVIISYGTHPCAYVIIDPGHDLFGKDYTDHYELYNLLNVHGGVTYTEAGLHNFIDNSRWVIGWDYNHLGDYSTLLINDGSEHKYTSEEIFGDVKKCIDGIIFAFD